MQKPAGTEKSLPLGEGGFAKQRRMRGGRGFRRSTDQSFPLEGGAPRSESKIYMTAGGSHTSTTVVRLKPNRMRSKVTASYKLVVIIDRFDLISRNESCDSFPSRGSLHSEVRDRLLL